MNIRAIGFYIGHLLRIEGVLLVPALLIALFRHEHASLRALGITILILAVLSMALLSLGRRGPFWKRRREAENSRSGEGIHAREGFVITALGWIALSLFGALPFYLSGAIPHFIDCWFETVSGFTTTGATILSEIEGLPMSLLYWRSFTHWIGGMGVLVFLLAIIPMSKGNGETFHLLRAESPGPSVGKLTPTMRHTARLLYAIYVALTVIMIGFLLAGGMPLFDSIVHAFGTAGTGGFSIKNASIAAYGSHYLQTTIAVFMVLFGVNFNVFYLILCKRASQALRSEELRAYLGILFGATVLIAFNILPQSQSLGDAFHHSFFQVASIMTTTGFSTVQPLAGILPHDPYRAHHHRRMRGVDGRRHQGCARHHPRQGAHRRDAAHAPAPYREGRLHGRQAAGRPCDPRRIRLHDRVHRRVPAFHPLHFD